MRDRRGFTLIEMLVVIIIIILMAGTTVMLMNTFFRNQGVRQACEIVKQTVAQTKTLSAEERRVHFLVFSPVNSATGEGFLEIHRDANEDNVYNGDYNPLTENDADPPIMNGLRQLPRGVIFETAPQWVAFQPSGYLMFSGGFPEVQAAQFDNNMDRNSPSELTCDIGVRVKGRQFWVLMDLDRAGGKVRRHFFMQKEQK